MYKKILCLCVFLLFAGYGCAAGSSSELERTVQAQGQLLIQNQQRIDALQSELDTLRGQLEENTYQLNQTIERQKMILQQTLGGPSTSNSSSFNSNSSNSGSSNNSFSSNSNGEADSLASASSESSTPNLSGWTTSGNDKNDYTFIMQFVVEGKQDNESIAAFQKFLQAYPKSSYQANANYWLGQLNYRQGKKNIAVDYYANVVKDYPNSPKAADSLYKLGLIFLDNGEKEKAKKIFLGIASKYPNDKNTIEQANKKLASL